MKTEMETAIRAHFLHERKLLGAYASKQSTYVDWRLCVRRSNINPAYKLCYRYRTRSGFTALEPNPTCNSDRKLGAKTKYFRQKRTVGV